MPMCRQKCENKMTDKLKYDPDRYTVKEKERDGVKIRYRAFEELPYCADPVSPAYQKLSIYVPEKYYEGSCIGGCSLHTAPVFMPNTIGGYMPGRIEEPGENFKGETNAAFAALSAGCVVVSPAARGRGMKNKDEKNIGTAPAGIVDLKAAIRYLRRNRKLLPGDTEKIITNGTSAGGAMSALLGASGNSREYEPYLKEIGAAEERDDIFATSCYCPITNLDHADMAYEWEFCGRNDYHCMKPEFEMPETDDPVKKKAAGASAEVLPDGRPRKLLRLVPADGEMSPEKAALSAPLKSMFPAYINSLRLKDRNGQALTLDNNGRGTFRNFIGHYVLKSINRAVREGQDLSGLEWIVWKDGTAVDFDFEKYTDYRTRMKETPAFDNVFGQPTAENEVFGTCDDDFCHFTGFGMQHRKDSWPMADPEVIRLMNPMNFIGSADAVTARYYRIRHGAADRDTSLAVSAMLTARLRNNGTEVDYHLPWGLPHSGDYDLRELFDWVRSICG